MISGSWAPIRRGKSSAGARVMVGLVDREGVGARLLIAPGFADSEVTDDVEVLRLCFGLISAADGDGPDLKRICAGMESKIELICSSRGTDGERGDFIFDGDEGIVGKDVSTARPSLSEKGLEGARPSSTLVLLRRFFMAKFRGGFDNWAVLVLLARI